MYSKPRNKITTSNTITLKGIVHIQTGYHNTIITFTNIKGDVLCWCSAGSCGFKGKRKSTGFAAKKAMEIATKKSGAAGGRHSLREAMVFVTGPGQGRESAIRELIKAGIKITVIREKTKIPHNGCRPPKRRRV
uniref:Ribosomal protein S11 n=1 Tax=Volvocales sp. NrCl902 TaxID=2682054 RepID=A0A7G1GG93_9CHLO|nr:ribosomal protein S11 [Volvocales sp. NrCl902]